MESLVKLRMEKLSSHFMGHLASFPFNLYCTEMCREYMPVSLPFWYWPLTSSTKGYINGSAGSFGLGLFSSTHRDIMKAPFQVQNWSMLLKTIAYKWHSGRHAAY